tara:strand:+ start:301 stop:606 length:306 start_codon:yes stop_codon:yes gene_type:complete
MRITKSKLKQLIKEEFETTVLEGQNDQVINNIVSSYIKMQKGALELQRMFGVRGPLFKLVESGKLERKDWYAAYKKIQEIYSTHINAAAELNNAVINQLKK